MRGRSSFHPGPGARLLVALVLLVACLVGAAPAGSRSVATREQEVQRGRAFLLATCDPDPAVAARVVEQIGALGQARAELVFARVSRWSDAWPERSGTSQEASKALREIVLHPKFGAEALGALLGRTGQDPGQALVLCFARNLSPAMAPTQGELRARDALVAVQAAEESGGDNAPVRAALTPRLGNMPTFHALRNLAPDSLTPVLHREFWRVRAAVPAPAPGEAMQKTLKLSKIQGYLSGEFGPYIFGFVCKASQVACLRTPADHIAGLRLDYPGGFQSETRVAILRWKREGASPVPVAYPAPDGPVQGGAYPYTGNGFTGATRALALGEYCIPTADKMPLNPGATLVELDEAGGEHLRGRWNGLGWVVPPGRVAVETKVRPFSASVRVAGHALEAVGRDDQYVYLGSFGEPLPQGLLEDQQQEGRLEYRGRVRIDDPRLALDPRPQGHVAGLPGRGRR